MMGPPRISPLFPPTPLSGSPGAPRPPPVARDRADGEADRDREQHRERAHAEGDPSAVDEPGPHVAPEAIGAQRVDRAAGVRGEWREEPRGDDVVLRRCVSGRDERCGERRCDDHDQHAGAEDGASVAQQPFHVAWVWWRIRGSIHPTSTSATRFPTTTRTALTAVPAITTG